MSTTFDLKKDSGYEFVNEYDEKRTHCIFEWNDINTEGCLKWFDSDDDAMIYLDTMVLKKEDYRVGEKKGELCDIYGTGEYAYPLFKGDNAPKTMKALRERMRNGKAVWLHQSSRAPMFYVMLPAERMVDLLRREKELYDQKGGHGDYWPFRDVEVLV